MGLAAAELKADREVVSAAIAEDWKTVELAAEELKADRDIILTAIAADWQAFKLAAGELKADPRFHPCSRHEELADHRVRG